MDAGADRSRTARSRVRRLHLVGRMQILRYAHSTIYFGGFARVGHNRASNIDGAHPGRQGEGSVEPGAALWAFTILTEWPMAQSARSYRHQEVGGAGSIDRCGRRDDGSRLLRCVQHTSVVHVVGRR